MNVTRTRSITLQLSRMSKFAKGNGRDFQRSRRSGCATRDYSVDCFATLSSGEERSADACTASNCEMRVDNECKAGRKWQLFTLLGAVRQKILVGTSTLG